MSGDHNMNQNDFNPDQLYINQDRTEYTFYGPPKANTKVSFGDDNNTYVQMYLKNQPNKIQRWLTYKVFGVKVERI